MRVPILAAVCTAALILAASSAACTTAVKHSRPTADGVINGNFVIVGGASAYNFERPVPGAITFVAAGRRTVVVRDDKSGQFSARLPSGYYRVCGTSPDLHDGPSGSNSNRTTCAPTNVKVSAGRKSYVRLSFAVP